MRSAISKLLNYRAHLMEKGFSGQILTKMIISLIEILELPNFGHIYNIILVTWKHFVSEVIE